ncbi:uncharacterized protein [Gorilla gorilla gorilla]|uniref:uncharacterized protein n=1 Tax=Gorilla gorilla gorilla TaxID=9595 RepID=UPI00300BB020
MAAATTKSWWETGEVQAQSAAKTPSCKDIVAGDMSKKSLWEQKGGSKTSSTIKLQTTQGEVILASWSQPDWDEPIDMYCINEHIMTVVMRDLQLSVYSLCFPDSLAVALGTG